MFIVGCINKINILKWMCETRSKEKFVWWGGEGKAPLSKDK